jgi:hypothetical protein
MVQNGKEQSKVEAAQNNKQSKIDEYFLNQKFFNEGGDIQAKRAFFMLGQYARKVAECEEKQLAESGVESKFQARLCEEKQLAESGVESKFQAGLAREISNNMSYRAFTIIMKLLDTEALKCNPQLFYRCSGACKELMINSALVNDKKALKPEDANMSFSLGMYQKF